MFRTWICEAKDGKPVGDSVPDFAYIILGYRSIVSEDVLTTEFFLLEISWLVMLILTSCVSSVLVYVGYSLLSSDRFPLFTGLVIFSIGLIFFLISLGSWIVAVAIYLIDREKYATH